MLRWEGAAELRARSQPHLRGDPAATRLPTARRSRGKTLLSVHTRAHTVGRRAQWILERVVYTARLGRHLDGPGKKVCEKSVCTLCEASGHVHTVCKGSVCTLCAKQVGVCAQGVHL